MYINTFVARRLDELMCKLNDTREVMLIYVVFTLATDISNTLFTGNPKLLSMLCLSELRRFVPIK